MLSLCPFDISVGVWAFVIGLSQISSFFSWNFVPMKYSWFAAHVNVIRANVSSMVVTLVSDWFTYFYPTAAWISKKCAERKYSKSIVCFSCCSVYKDDRTGFWLADTLSNSQQPLHRMARVFFCSEFGSVLRTQSQCQIVPFFPKGGQKWPLSCRLSKWKLLSTNI